MATVLASGRRGRALAAAVSAAAAGTALGAAPPLGPLPRSARGPVLREPRPQDYYGFLREYAEVPLAEFSAASAPTVPRLRNLEDETFQQLVRDGSPFVVEDCTKGFDQDAISEFTCRDFADRWPSGNMRAEYTPGQYHIYLRDPSWYSKVHPQRSHSEHMAKSQKIAGPYIWHVKDEEPLKTKREVQRHWRTPYFLQRSIANRMEANESFEFWFSMAGGGTFAHADSYCETTISMQFRGKKRWRVQSFPRVTHYLNATRFGDEHIYDGKQHVPWTPETEFEVGPGECVVFPTGYLHETFVDPAENDGGCYTASTFQMNHPRQVNLYRAYLSSFAMSHYGTQEPCVENVRPYATLFSRADFTRQPSAAAMRQEAEALLVQIDADGDQRLTQKELYAAFCSDKKQRRHVMKEGGFYYSWIQLLSKPEFTAFVEEAMRTWTEDALQYHDVDRDGFVSLDELAQSLLQWNVVQHRLARMRQSLRTAGKPQKWLTQVLADERAALKQYYCEPGGPCPEDEELAAHGEALRKSKSALPSTLRRVVGLFEDLEGQENEELMIMDRETGGASQVRVGNIVHTEL